LIRLTHGLILSKIPKPSNLLTKMGKKNYGRCTVCGDDAIGMNFGVSTCMPCKAFFRRNAFRFNVRQLID